MKDYYDTLNVPRGASAREIKTAFRRLAFRYHPDKNPGKELEAERMFREIGEAYGVLGDEAKRREYDAFLSGRRGSGFDAGGAYGSGYGWEGSFNNAFAADDVLRELNRMFARAGLRFDADFVNRVFYGSGGTGFDNLGTFGVFRYSSQRYKESARSAAPDHPRSVEGVERKPNLVARLGRKAIGKLGKFLLGRAFGLADETGVLRGADIHEELVLSSAEIARGCRKRLAYQRGDVKKRVEVTVPRGVPSGTRIRLRGMGLPGKEPGDLYLHLKVKP